MCLFVLVVSCIDKLTVKVKQTSSVRYILYVILFWSVLLYSIPCYAMLLYSVMFLYCIIFSCAVLYCIVGYSINFSRERERERQRQRQRQRHCLFFGVERV